VAHGKLDGKTGGGGRKEAAEGRRPPMGHTDSTLHQTQRLVCINVLNALEAFKVRHDKCVLNIVLAAAGDQSDTR
jgi:hypothetical protein